jgi:hypothetical protein
MQWVRRLSWLKEISFYFAALVAVIGSLYFGVDHVGGAVQEHMRGPNARETTKLDQMVNSAREIREAIANAKHSIEPLQARAAIVCAAYSLKRISEATRDQAQQGGS